MKTSNKKKTLFVHYDKEGDMLELRFGKPQPATFVDLGRDIFQRVDDETGKISGLTVFNFTKRKLNNLDVSLSLNTKCNN